MLGCPWVAVDVTTDLVERADTLRRAWEGFLSGAVVDERVRPPILESWRRCVQAGVRPVGRPEPPLLAADGLADRWQGHPLYGLVPLLHESLGGFAEAWRRIVAVSDEDGRLLWIEGDRQVRSRAADEIGFAEGALWSESAVGTNAIGTAIAVDHPIQMFAGSHFNEAVQSWTCAGAPIHDPTSGELIGVVDLTGPLETVHPDNLALAAASARMIEAQLRWQQRDNNSKLRARYRDRVLEAQTQRRALVSADGRVLLAEPRGCVPSVVEVPAGAAELTLPGDVRARVEPLGQDGCFLLHLDERPSTDRAARLKLVALGGGVAYLGRRELRLTQRHAEILVLLAAHPDGLTTEQLALALHGEAGKPATARVEMFRMRKLLEPWICSRPWRLSRPVAADFLDVQRLLRQGQVGRAIREYSAPLLPRSEATEIVEIRNELDAAVRHAAMTCGDREVLWGWLQTPSGSDDVPAWKRFLAGLDANDGRRALTASRLTRLRESLAPAGRPPRSQRVAA